MASYDDGDPRAKDTGAPRDVPPATAIANVNPVNVRLKLVRRLTVRLSVRKAQS